MARTIQCPNCGVVLNVPESAAGRRLKCPRCATRFGGDGGPGPSSSGSLGPPVDDAGPATAQYPVVRGPGAAGGRPAPGGRPASGEDDLPTAAGDLRETFDLPLMMGEDTPAAPARGKAPPPVDDAVALFQDAPPPRKVTAAEARARSRRCPTCGSLVPAGMSLCNTCGFDLESGQHIGLADDLDPVAPPRRQAGLPIGIAIVGGLSLLASAVLGVVALFAWQNQGVEGAQLLALVCVFGVYAAVQFLRGRSVKLLAIALTLGAMIDVLAMVALPIYNAHEAAAASVADMPIDPDQTGVGQPITDFLDLQQIYWGIGLLLAYAGLALYLNSPPVRRHFERRSPIPGGPPI